MSNNFKQAFNEVFGLDKNPEGNQEQTNTNISEGDKTQIPKQFENFEGFEELEPTGKTISEDAKTLIDQKANLFSESLGLNLGQNSKQKDEETSFTDVSSDSNKEYSNYSQNEAVKTYQNIIDNSNKEDLDNTKEKDEPVTDKKEVDSPVSQSQQEKQNEKSEKEKKTPFFAKEFISKKDIEKESKTDTMTSFKNILNETTEKENKIENSLQNEFLNPTNMADLSSSSLQSTYTLKPVATTFIDHGTKIEGSITSNSNLNIAGSVVGDINCNNDVFVSGNIEGNVSCDNFVADNSAIKGNIVSKKTLVLKNSSSIVGDISADNIEINGKVNGNIVSATELSILSSSSVIGDITAKSISVEKGSVIQGRVNINFE